MCGIGGIVETDGPAEPDLLLGLSRALGHRGPDDIGFLSWGPGRSPTVGREPEVDAGDRVSFVHRRLAIIDLTVGGWQPMSSSEGRYHIVFNGEIYNYREIRKELSEIGHRFVSTSDTEVLLQAYGHWGVAAFPRLIGMYALAILDTLEGQVVLARDPLGIKPLFIATGDTWLAFASEIPALLALPKVPRTVAPQPLVDYLEYGLTDHTSSTMFAGISHIRPGHVATVPVAKPSAWLSRDLTGRIFDPEPLDVDFDTAAGLVRQSFLEHIDLHLRSDIPVGAALSGGIDSSSIVTAMRAVGGPSLPIATFSYIPDEPRISEEKWVDLVVADVGAEPHKVGIDPQGLADNLDAVIYRQGEPFASSSVAAQHEVFRSVASAGIRVMLDGQGADELLGGYRSFLATRCTDLVRAGQPAAAIHLARTASRLPGNEAAAAVLFRSLAPLVPSGLAQTVDDFRRHRLRPTAMSHKWFIERGARGRRPATLGLRGGSRGATLDLLTCSSLPALLRYEDRNSMAFSIESRVPFSTPAFVSLALSLPADYIVGADAVSKRVLRAAMRGLVPDPILDRRDKIGFATPEASLLTALDPWVRGVFADAETGIMPALDMPIVHRQWELVRAGRSSLDGRIWRWINLIRWAQVYGAILD